MTSKSPRERWSNDHALFDYSLPAFVRSFIAINQLDATCTFSIREAGHMSKVYGLYRGEPVRVTMVSRLGDVGVSRENEDHGYFERCSIYDIESYSETPIAV